MTPDRKRRARVRAIGKAFVVVQCVAMFFVPPSAVPYFAFVIAIGAYMNGLGDGVEQEALRHDAASGT